VLANSAFYINQEPRGLDSGWKSSGWCIVVSCLIVLLWIGPLASFHLDIKVDWK